MEGLCIRGGIDGVLTPAEDCMLSKVARGCGISRCKVTTDNTFPSTMGGLTLEGVDLLAFGVLDGRRVMKKDIYGCGPFLLQPRCFILIT